MQTAGITDMMRVNILNIISTSIDTHGPSEMQKIAKDVKTWLDETYGKYWAVEISGASKNQPVYMFYESKYLKVKETRLGWTIQLYKQSG